MAIGHCNCNPCGCTISVTFRDYQNVTLVPGSPPAFPDSKASPWALDQRMAEGDCASIFHDFNCYEALEITTTITEDKRGMQLVTARKGFHGGFPWDYCAVGPCDVEPTRYLSVSIDAQLELITSESSPDPLWFSSYIGASGVGRTTGCDTGTITQDATDDIGTTGYSKAELEDFTTQIAGIRPQCVELEGEIVTAWVGPVYTGFETPAAHRAAIQAAWEIWGRANILLHGNAFGGGTGTGTSISCTTNNPAGTLGELIGTWDLGSGSSYHFSLSIELTDENTAANNEADVKAAAATWNLGADYLRWRQDTYRALAPLVDYYEVRSRVAPTGTNATSCDQDGRLLGTPFTLGLPDTSFGFDVYGYNTGGCSVTSYGKFTPGLLPPQATNHTSSYNAGREEAWPGYGYRYENGEVLLQKGMEVLEHYSSCNFFPIPSRRWLLDTGVYTDGTTSAVTSSYITDITDPVLTTNTDISAAFGGGTRLVSITGGAHDNEIWYATASGTAITLISQLVTDSDEWDYVKGLVNDAYEAAGWHTISQCDQGRVGILRFQYDRSGTQWPMKVGIAGRVAVTASYDSGADETTFTLASAQQLITGDLVDVLAADNSSLFANKSWTWVSATSGTVPGDCSTDAAFLKSSGAPHYLWNDDEHYGDFVVQSTSTSIDEDNNLVHTVTNTDNNAGTGPCPVIACTPNGDAPAGATSIAFPSYPENLTCAAHEWVYIEQRMRDPWWQEPISECDSYIGCPHLVEARVALRPGSRGGETCPAFPAGVGFTVPDSSPVGAGTGGACEALSSDVPWGGCG